MTNQRVGYNALLPGLEFSIALIPWELKYDPLCPCHGIRGALSTTFDAGACCNAREKRLL